MIIKTFTAESNTSALKQVRSELGGDAVVLKTRRVANKTGGYDYEVTACLDKPTAARVSTVTAKKESPAARRVTAPAWTRPDTAPKSTPVSTENEPSLTSINAKLERLLSLSTGTPSSTESDNSLARVLNDADVPADIVIRIASVSSDAAQLEKLLGEEIDSRIDATLSFKAGDRVVVLGPSGAGKTSVIGKLAAQLVTERKRVTIVGVHQSKVGAIDELQILAELIGVDNPPSSGGVLRTADPSGVVLIDTGSLSISTEDITALNATHTLLVVPAIWRTSDLATLADRVAAFGITHVVLTMTDLTHRIGGLFAVCDITGAKLALLSDSPSGADCLRVPAASALAAKLLSNGGTHAVR